MINAAISAIESAQLRTDIPEFRVGDTVRVHYRIVEGEKDRIQVFQGVVIKRHRAGARSTFTVRKVSFNVGVERVFLQHSPRIDKVELLSRGVVRRARLFYLRDLSGKAARLRDEKDKLDHAAFAPHAAVRLGRIGGPERRLRFSPLDVAPTRAAFFTKRGPSLFHTAQRTHMLRHPLRTRVRRMNLERSAG